MRQQVHGQPTRGLRSSRGNLWSLRSHVLGLQMRTFFAAISLVLGACGSAGSTGTDDESGEGSTSSTGPAPTTSTTTTSATSVTSSADASTGAVDGSSSEGGEESSSTTDDGPPPAPCDVEMPLPPGDYDRMLEHGGVMRRYLL